MAARYKTRWQNGRNRDYKDMILDKKFIKYFPPKLVKFLSFVESDDEDLIDSKHNQLFTELVDVREGRAQPMVRTCIGMFVR